MTIGIHTDFKRKGARPFKRFRIEGLANHELRHRSDLRRYRRKHLFNGKAKSPCATASRHIDIISQSWRWHCGPSTNLQQWISLGSFFGLSAALWMSCHEGREE